MEDRFKFRAWHETDSVMVYFDKKDRYQIEHLFDLMRGEHQEGGVLEQCTGLKDKNGKLIFEGDIVMNDGFMYVVCWSEESFIIGTGWGVVDPVDLLVNEGCDDCMAKYCLTGDCEILGNVHESSELI